MSAREICLLLAIGLPLVGAPLLAIAGRRLGRRVSLLALVFPIVSTVAILALSRGLAPGVRAVIEWPWIPSLGLPLSFMVDGLSVFFGLVVSGMGVLIFYYARHYLDERYRHQGRFYCFLSLFMAAMLGTVFANHLLLLFVFWELTGLASFLLIGFEHTEAESRRGARMALLVTGATGLLMLAGVVVLGQNAGTYRLEALLAEPGRFAGKEWFNMAFLLVAVGAFGKSAQFPFHFWLPNAMAAPTPVSAYLHSATMVKLGVFLVARVLPIFQASDWWLPLLTVIGFGTLLLGTTLALLSHDLKAILAYSTVSQLGYLIGSYGVAPAGGIDYDYLHILNHVFYKGSLFMLVGIIDHAVGTRDLRDLGGLWRRMPLVGAVCLVSAATMAGMIGTTGFISKEVVFHEIFGVMREHGWPGAFAAVAVVLASLLKVAFSCRIFFGAFCGREPAGLGKHFHAPSVGFVLPPLVLAGATLLFGCMPGLLEGPLDLLSVSALHTATPTELALWHGFTPELGASAAVVLAGLGVFGWGTVTRWRWTVVPRWLRWDVAFDAAVEVFGGFTKWLTRMVGADNPNAFLPIILTCLVAGVGGFVLWRFPLTDWQGLLAEGVQGQAWSALRVLVAGLTALGALGVIGLRSWTAQLISLSVCGFLLCVYFVLYRAPDVALTQILVETVTLILVLYLLGRFPKSAQRGEEVAAGTLGGRVLPVILAVGVGALMCGLSLLVTARPAVGRIGDFYVENTVAMAEGDNAVNTILVDFRGFDTLGEITVLLIAMLGVLGLLMRYKRSPEQFREGPLGPPGYGIHHKEMR
jgi:NADH:ubiquinone oxidoreductase subunit 5 (subunit L)/multisubunit Na+/H+ antiporter MnhA subunit/multisubunit Na+/H+ antiporter MnhB subunit